MLDTSIPLSVKPVQFESPLNALAQIAQLQGAQQQNALAQMQMDAARRGVDETNSLNDLWRTAVRPDGTVDTNAIYSGAASRGLGSKVPALQKSIAEADEARGKVAKQKVELVDAKLKQSRERLTDVRTPQEYLEWHQANHADPILGPELAARGITPEKSMASIQQALQTPGGFQDLLRKSALGLEKFTELNKPTTNVVDTGGQKQMVQTPGLGGAPTVAQTFQNTQSPDNAASVAASIANNQRSVGAQLANANATREIASATRDAATITAEGKRRTDTEMKLADDYRTESKGFAETSTAMKKVLGSIETADKNPGSALAAGTAFMKLLDPNSVVRESELGMALNASGWFDRATNVAATLQHGRIMTPEQQKNLRAAAADLFEEAKGAQREIDAAYRKRATDYKLDPQRVITDRGQNTSRTAPAAPAASGGALSPAEQKELDALRARFRK